MSFAQDIYTHRSNRAEFIRRLLSKVDIEWTLVTRPGYVRQFGMWLSYRSRSDGKLPAIVAAPYLLRSAIPGRETPLRR